MQAELRTGLVVLAFITLGAVAVAGTDPQDDGAPGPSPAALFEQVHSFVLEGLQLNRQASSQLKWESSGFIPSDIFSHVRQVSNESQTALCQSLALLSPVDLALFEDELEAGTPENLRCRADLLAKLNGYWEIAEHKLQAEAAAAPKDGALYSEEIQVDLHSRGVLTSAALKAGEFVLSFDDGPHAKYTASVLETLQNAGVRAMFFRVGKKVKAQSELVQKSIQLGNPEGSHTYNHRSALPLPINEELREMTEGHQAVDLASGTASPFYRFFSENISEPRLGLANHAGLIPVAWDIDSEDWKIQDPSLLLARLRQAIETQDRGIIRLHDIYRQTVIVLPHLLDTLRAKNSRVVVFVAN